MSEREEKQNGWSKILKMICQYQRLIIENVEIESKISRKNAEITGYEFTVVFDVKSFRNTILNVVVRYHNTAQPPPSGWFYFVCDPSVSTAIEKVFMEKCKILERIVVL